MDVTTVVLAVEEGEVAEEVMHFLDRSGRARVIATATDASQLEAALRQTDPDALVASPRLISSHDVPVLAVDTRETVSSLRAAVRAGARGFYVWPGERGELAAAIEEVGRPGDDPGRRATAIAVYGARGGVGGTFVASHLAAALVAGDRSVVLVDLDPAFDDLSAALGVRPDDHVRTASDLVPLVDELTVEHLDTALWPHPSGVRALLAPREAGGAPGAREYAAMVSAATAMADAVVLHVPRGVGPIARWAFDEADRVLVVTSLDVIAFRATRRALDSLADGDADRCDFVVNRAARGEIVPADVRRAFGRPPIAVIPVDRAVAAAQDHGRLVGPRSRAGRAVAHLARTLAEAT